MTRTRGLILTVAAIGSIAVAGCASSVGGQPAQITTAPTLARPTAVTSTAAGAATGSSIMVSLPPSSPQVLPPSPSPVISPVSSAPPKSTQIVPGSTVTLVVTASPVPPTSPATPAPVTATRRSTVTATVTATGAGDVQTIDAFQSPSGNIACSMDSDGVRCDVRDLTFTPPKPAECSMGVPHAIRLATGAKPAFICISDTVADPGLPVLAYGSTTRAHGFTCVSQEDGMHCSDDGTGNGFRLARASYDLG